MSASSQNTSKLCARRGRPRPSLDTSACGLSALVSLHGRSVSDSAIRSVRGQQPIISSPILQTLSPIETTSAEPRPPPPIPGSTQDPQVSWFSSSDSEGECPFSWSRSTFKTGTDISRQTSPKLPRRSTPKPPSAASSAADSPSTPWPSLHSLVPSESSMITPNISPPTLKKKSSMRFWDGKKSSEGQETSPQSSGADTLSASHQKPLPPIPMMMPATSSSSGITNLTSNVGGLERLAVSQAAPLDPNRDISDQLRQSRIPRGEELERRRYGRVLTAEERAAWLGRSSA